MAAQDEGDQLLIDQQSITLLIVFHHGLICLGGFLVDGSMVTILEERLEVSLSRGNIALLGDSREEDTFDVEQSGGGMSVAAKRRRISV